MTTGGTGRWPGLRSRWGSITTACGLALLLSAGLVARGLRPNPDEPPSAAGQASPDQVSAPPPVVLRFAAAGHARAGSMNAATATDTRVLAPGARGEVAFAVGTTARPEFCDVGTLDEREADEAFLLWRAEASVVRVDGEQIDLQLTWRRQMAAGAAAAGSQLVRLRDGHSHLLDVVAADPATSARCHYASFDVTATLGPSPTEALLAYRLWLLFNRDGQRVSAGPVEVLGASGEPVPFRLRPVTWPLADSMARGPSAPAVTLEVLGRVTGTLTTPETVTASLQVTRRLHVGMWLGGSGTMPIRGRLGEPVTVGLPVPGGYDVISSVAASVMPTLPRGVTRRGADLQVSLADYFAGSDTTLVLVTERVR